ncbi:hypothetical protein KAU05_03155 [Candidatus Aerophobetes bacterium]|nr:hypothetical protein [Candidatus Aerophobetes bacterium]
MSSLFSNRMVGPAVITLTPTGQHICGCRSQISIILAPGGENETCSNLWQSFQDRYGACL